MNKYDTPILHVEHEKGQYASFFHVTTPAVAKIILRDGFIDHAAQKGVPGLGVTHTFEPGVWFADIPPITAICVDQYFGMTDNAWICIRVAEPDYDRCFVGNEWQDAGWPTRQWLIPAAEANKFPRHEMPLEHVLFRRFNHGLAIEDVKALIESEMPDPLTKARWINAVAQAECLLKISNVIGRA